jgi:hypothetical protein
MRLRIDDPELLDELLDHFGRAGFTVQRAGEDTIEIGRPDAPSADQARREVEVHLRLWRALHPGASIELG